MRILGFVNAFDELADADRRLGRKVANYGLTAALLEHSTCDELHFYLPFYAALSPFEEGYAQWLTQPEVKDRVRLLHAAALPSTVERTDYLAIHAAELDRYFPELCHLRNRWARSPFPVTCTPHTLCYWSTQVRNLYKALPGPQPYDSIFCTSRAAAIHLESSLAAMAARLAELGLAGAGYAGRLDIAPLGVRLADLPPLDQAQARAGLGLEPGVFTWLCLGRLTPSDKFDLAPLLGALALVNQSAPAHLVLAGAEHRGYGRVLLDLAASMGLGGRVTVIADFDSSQKSALYHAADVFVSPADNLQETFGLAIVEAMACGLPVVASDFSGYRDLVEEGRTGFLIPTLGPADYGPLDAAWPLMAEHVATLHAAQRTALDLEALVGRLLLLAHDRELRLSLGRAGRRRAAERFAWAAVVKRMEGLWDELKAQARAAGRPAPAANVMDAGLGRVFGHFPSGRISPATRLRPGPLAPAFAQGAWARHPYPDLAQTLTPQGLEALLRALQARGGVASLEELQAGLGQGLPPYLVEHLALWGLKYGVLGRG